MARDSLGAVLLSKGQAKEALTHFRKAQEIAPNNAEVQDGIFCDAVPTAENALQLASNRGQTSLVDLIRREIELYQVGLPFRDER